MSPGPRLSVIVPTRNRLGFLGECVDSILRGSATRVIIVDDASEDGTAEWLRSLADPRIESVSLAARVGGPEARNRGLMCVHTPFVMFVDDDDLLIAEAAEQLVDRLDREPSAIASIGLSVDIEEDGQRCQRLGPSRDRVCNIFPEVLAGWCPCQGQVVYRTDAVRAVGAWSGNLKICNEYELWLRFAQAGLVDLTPLVTIEVRQHEGQTPWHTDEDVLCIGKELSRSAAKQWNAPFKAARVHAGAWGRYRAPILEGRGHPLGAAASYLMALLVSLELRRSVIMGPEMRQETQRLVRSVIRRRPKVPDGACLTG